MDQDYTNSQLNALPTVYSILTDSYLLLEKIVGTTLAPNIGAEFNDHLISFAVEPKVGSIYHKIINSAFELY